MREEPFHMGPMMSGAVCGLVIVPQAIIAGPFIAILGLPVTLVVGGLAGPWEIGMIFARGILSGLGFLVATVLVVLFSGGKADGVGPFMIFPQLVTGVLSVFGITCN